MICYVLANEWSKAKQADSRPTAALRIDVSNCIHGTFW